MMPYDVNIKETQVLRGNITIAQGGSGSECIGRKIEIINNDDEELTLAPNIFYDIKNTYGNVILISTVGVDLEDAAAGIVNEYEFKFTSTKNIGLYFEDDVKLQTIGNVELIDTDAINIKKNKTYLVRIVEGLGLVILYD